jgi:hypothetical protein
MGSDTKYKLNSRSLRECLSHMHSRFIERIPGSGGGIYVQWQQNSRLNALRRLSFGEYSGQGNDNGKNSHNGDTKRN